MPTDPTIPAAGEFDLATLRVDIDRIDSQMHGLLMQRGQIIDKLIAIKAAQGGGSAFRPGREAAMMRAFAERHEGILPLDTVEGIWRIIISTFTYVQSNYSVHVDASGGDPSMRDSARFHFGFTVPYLPRHGAGEVIAAVARSGGDLGLVRIDSGIGGGAWWEALRDPSAPKVIARLPFVQRQDHPAGLPVYVLSLPLHEAASREVIVYAAAIEKWRDGVTGMLAGHGASILGNSAAGSGLSLMISAPGDVSAQMLAEGFRDCGLMNCRIVEIGSHAAQFRMEARPA